MAAWFRLLVTCKTDLVGEKKPTDPAKPILLWFLKQTLGEQLENRFL